MGGYRNGFLNVKKIFSHTISLCDDLYGQPVGPETGLAVGVITPQGRRMKAPGVSATLTPLPWSGPPLIMPLFPFAADRGPCRAYGVMRRYRLGFRVDA